MDQKPKLFFGHKEKGHIEFSSKSSLKKYIGCERKQGLTNLVANNLVKKYAQKGRMLRTYLCPTCKMWHLTHTNKS